jgi:carboxyl-terminal processing protease
MLTILRHNEHDFREIEVKRGEVASPTVYYELKEDGIAYIRVAQFESVTSKQFEEKLEQARRDGMKGLLIDLRSNPGGTLESVLKMCRMILPKGMIVYMEDKYGKRDEFKCAGDSQLEVPLVVLINENTASAAEIMAGAIKDHGIGTLVGKNTFGKGIVQKVFFLSDGSAIKLTISHYYTPNGNDIHEVGIKPDIDIDLDVDKYLDEKIDTQYEKAVSVLKDKMKG